MRRNRMMLLCLGLTIIFVAGLAPARSEQAKQITCTGKVVDEQDQPIAGVKVTLHGIIYNEEIRSYDTKVTGEVTTGTDGAFSFSTNAASDVYRYGYIVAEKEGLALDFANWNFREGDKQLQIKMSQPKELAGIVVDESGKPVSDAQVSISILMIGSMQDEHGIPGPVATELFKSITDAAGKFKFTKIPAEAAADFIVKKEGRATVRTYKSIGADQKLNYAAGQTDIKLVLPIEAKIEGIVVQKSTGNPVGGVQLIARSEQDLGYFRNKPLVSNEDGTFILNALASDIYTLRLATPTDELADWIAEPVEVITETGKTKSNVKIELLKGGILEVVVTDAVTKQPVEKASVSVRNQASSEYQNGRSDKDGIARIRLVPGEYQISYVYKEGFSRQRSQDAVTIEEGKTEHMEYELAGMPKVAGVVRDTAGKPLEGVKLKICPTGGRQDSTTDSEGKFEISWDPGRWGGERETVFCLVARHEERNLAAAEEISEDIEKLEIKLTPGVIIAGKVVDPDGKGIEVATLNANLRVSSWGSPIGRERITTDSQGKFEIRAVPADNKYNLYARAEGYGERSEEFDTNNAVDNRLDAGTITLAVANLSVSGVVVDDEDKPVAGAEIYCYGDNQPSRRAQTDTEGKFTLENVCAGKIRLNVNKRGSMAARLYGNIETEGGATGVQIVISQRSLSTRYQPKRPPSLVGRPLPELKDVKVEIPSSDTEGKMILVCFFDIEQRPSRYCVNQLAKQANQLKQKGVIIVAVQASKIDENTLNEWVKKYKIPFPVGMVQGEVEKSRFAWGVRSLPWLFLTDRKHVVRAEGFGINDLNEKIGGIENAEP